MHPGDPRTVVMQIVAVIVGMVVIMVVVMIPMVMMMVPMVVVVRMVVVMSVTMRVVMLMPMDSMGGIVRTAANGAHHSTSNSLTLSSSPVVICTW